MTKSPLIHRAKNNYGAAMNSKLKIGLTLFWIACAVSLVIQLPAPIQTVLWWVGGGLLVGHVIECVIFTPRISKAGGNRALHYLQVLLFGVIHAQTLPR